MKTKLWILRPAENLPNGDDPWEPWYDKAFGFVVRASTEAEARKLANADAGDENRGEFKGTPTSLSNTPWLHPTYSTCNLLLNEGEAGVIMEDLHSA